MLCECVTRDRYTFFNIYGKTTRKSHTLIPGNIEHWIAHWIGLTLSSNNNKYMCNVHALLNSNKLNYRTKIKIVIGQKRNRAKNWLMRDETKIRERTVVAKKCKRMWTRKDKTISMLNLSETKVYNVPYADLSVIGQIIFNAPISRVRSRHRQCKTYHMRHDLSFLISH